MSLHWGGDGCWGHKSRWLRGFCPPNIKQGRLALNIHTTNTTHATTHARVCIVERAHAQAHSERERESAHAHACDGMGRVHRHTCTRARARTHTHTTVTSLRFRRDFGRSLSLPSGHGLVGRGHGKGLSIHGVDRPVLKFHHLRVRRVRPLLSLGPSITYASALILCSTLATHLPHVHNRQIRAPCRARSHRSRRTR